MPLTKTTIRSRLAGSNWVTRDNEAQAIVKGATAAELSALDAGSTMMLFDAMSGGYKSTRDRAAIATLSRQTRFQLSRFGLTQAVALIRESETVKANAAVDIYVTEKTVRNIYAAERKRLSRLERWGFDGSTVGRGQLGQLAFTDVVRVEHAGFRKAWANWSEAYCAASRLAGRGAPSGAQWSDPDYVFTPPGQYSAIHYHSALEDFVVAGYLAIKIKAATKPKRSAKDAVRIGVAIYHGMYPMVVDAQEKSGDITNWAPVEDELSNAGHKDEVAYVQEVIP